MPPLLYISRNRRTDGIPTAHAIVWENEPQTLTPRLSVSILIHGSWRSAFNTLSPEPVQTSGLTLKSSTSAWLTPSAGVSSSDSFVIDPTPLELGGFQEGH